MWRKRKTSFLGKEIPSWQTALRVAWQSHPGVMATCTSFNFALQKCSLILPNPFHPTLVCLTLPYTLLPYTTLPYPILPSLVYRTVVYLTLTTLPHPPHPTLPYLALPNMHVSFNPGRESNAALYAPRNPSWRLATTHRRISARYRNSLSSSAASLRDLSSDDSVPAGTSKLSKSRFAKSVTRKEQADGRNAHPLPSRGRLANRASDEVRCHFVSDRIWIWNSLGCRSRIPDVQVIESRSSSSDASHFMRVQFAYVNC